MAWNDTPPTAEEIQPSWASAPPTPEELGQQSPLGKFQDASNAVAESAGNAATFGHLPQIEAKAQPIVDRLSNFLASQKGQGPEAPWEQFTENGPDYIKARDANIARMEAERARNPNLSKLGTGIGVVGSAMATPLPELEALGAVGGAVARGAGYGAVAGAAQNPGDKPGELSGPQLEERMKNAGIGGLTGGVTGAVVNPATMNTIGSKVYDSGIKKILQRGSDYGKEDVGQLLRNMGIWGSADTINQEVGAAKGPLWAKVQDAMKEAEANGANFDMKAAMQPAVDKIAELRASKIPGNQKIADRLEQEVNAHMAMQPEIPGSDEFPSTQRERTPMSTALEAKTAINEMTPDAAWNVNRKSPTFKKVTEPLRSGIGDEISNQIEQSSGPEARQQFERNNSDYGKLATIKPAANQMAKIESNKNGFTPVDATLLALKPKVEIAKKLADLAKGSGVRTGIGYGMTQMATPAASNAAIKTLANPQINPWEQSQ